MDTISDIGPGLIGASFLASLRIKVLLEKPESISPSIRLLNTRSRTRGYSYQNDCCKPRPRDKNANSVIYALVLQQLKLERKCRKNNSQIGGYSVKFCTLEVVHLDLDNRWLYLQNKALTQDFSKLFAENETNAQSVSQQLLLHFIWWVNRKDAEDNNVFEGVFLG